jgi:hypothetical protein
MANFFKKLGGSIKSAFSKGGALQQAFKKGGIIQTGLTTGLHDVAHAIGSVANNPIVNQVAKFIPGASTALDIAKQGSQFIDPSTYKSKDTLENLADAAKRGGKLAVKAAPLFV